jgi:hypothetical protein
MALNSTFSPQGPTYLLVGTAIQILSNGQNAVQSYRIRNLSSSSQYFTWGAASSVTSVGAPSAGVPSANTIGMIGNSVETISGLPVGVWMIASSATGFEVTPGEGM